HQHQAQVRAVRPLLLPAAFDAGLHLDVGTGGRGAGAGVQAQVEGGVVRADVPARDVLVGDVEGVGGGEAAVGGFGDVGGGLVGAEGAEEGVFGGDSGAAAVDAGDGWVGGLPGGVVFVAAGVVLVVGDGDVVVGGGGGAEGAGEGAAGEGGQDAVAGAVVGGLDVAEGDVEAGLGGGQVGEAAVVFAGAGDLGQCRGDHDGGQGEADEGDQHREGQRAPVVTCCPPHGTALSSVHSVVSPRVVSDVLSAVNVMSVCRDDRVAVALVPVRRLISSRWKFAVSSASRKVNVAAVTVDARGTHFVGVSLPGPGTAGAGGCVQVRCCSWPECTRSSVQTRLPVFEVRYSTYGSPLTVVSLLIAAA